MSKLSDILSLNISSPKRASFGAPFSSNINNNQKRFPKLNFKKILRVIVPLIFIMVIIIVIKNVFGKSESAFFTQGSTNSERFELKKPKAKIILNRQFRFPLRDARGKELSQFLYVVESAELRDEIIVKGKRATAIKGRIFLILNLKVTNSYNRGIDLNSRDYIRISVNNSRELLAPDIHNDPVEVQAISTKYTRVGVALNDTDTNHILQAGEVDGKKEIIKLSF